MCRNIYVHLTQGDQSERRRSRDEILHREFVLVSLVDLFDGGDVTFVQAVDHFLDALEVARGRRRRGGRRHRFGRRGRRPVVVQRLGRRRRTGGRRLRRHDFGRDGGGRGYLGRRLGRRRPRRVAGAVLQGAGGDGFEGGAERGGTE